MEAVCGHATLRIVMQLLANDEVQLNSPEASLRASTHMSHDVYKLTLQHIVALGLNWHMHRHRAQEGSLMRH